MTYRQTQHGVAKGGLGLEGDEAARGDNTRTYRMAFPEKAGPRTCPVEGCSVRALTHMAMMVHLWHWHVRYTVAILE